MENKWLVRLTTLQNLFKYIAIGAFAASGVAKLIPLVLPSSAVSAVLLAIRSFCISVIGHLPDAFANAIAGGVMGALSWLGYRGYLAIKQQSNPTKLSN
jgi:hypothetical protein